MTVLAFLLHLAVFPAIVGMAQPCGDRRGPRIKKEIDQERRKRYDRTATEIDRILAEFHARLPQEAARMTGAVYCRYSTRFQDSIGDQVRTILEHAVREGVYVPREYIFFDLAVRGYKSQRAGLDQLRQLLRSKKVSIVMFFATNRLFRKLHRSLEFVEEEVVERGIDAVFVKSGVDTRDEKRWRMLLSFHSMMDEFVVGMYSDNIRASHEGLLGKQLVFGTTSYGYTGEPMEGEKTRRGRPRRRLIIDQVAGPVVQQIYDWYVEDRLQISKIIEKLNDDPSIPLPPRCTSGMWTRLAVKGILTNSRYRGLWQYGVTESVWISSKDYTRQRVRQVPLKEVQIEELRLVSDEVWFAVQKRISEKGRRGGRKPSDGDRQSRPKILNGLLRCPEHDRALHVGGADGKSMICPSCRRLKREKRNLFTQLNRRLALRLTCQRLADLVRADDNLVEQIIEACRQEAEALQRPDPRRISELESQAEQLGRRIQFVLNHVGESAEDQQEAERTLQELRQQRAETRVEIDALKKLCDREIVIPTCREARTLLEQLGEILVSAADSDQEEVCERVHALLSELTGGRIDLYQMGERKPQRGWLQGRFHVNVVSYVTHELTNLRLGNTEENGQQVVIDFRAPKLVDQQAEEAKRLWDDGWLNKDIAEQMCRNRSYVTKLLNHWFESRGLPREDGRKRRSGLKNKQTKLPAYKQLADEVVQLKEHGNSNLEIAKQLKVSDACVAKSISWWFQKRNLPVPTAKEWRLKRLQRARSLSGNLAR